MKINSQTSSMKDNKHITLEEIGKELPFGVPENYFEQFANQMEAQIAVKRTPFRKVLINWMSMAAMFVGILIMGQIFYTVYQNNTVKNEDNYELYVLSQVDESSLIDYYVDDSSVK